VIVISLPILCERLRNDARSSQDIFTWLHGIVPDFGFLSCYSFDFSAYFGNMTNDQLRELGRSSVAKLIKAPKPVAIPKPDLAIETKPISLLSNQNVRYTIIGVAALLVGIGFGYGCKGATFQPLKGKIGGVNVVQQNNGDMVGEDGSVFRVTKWEKVK
jgi:hypothetical protein